jgi:hypothetical protein
MKLFRILCGKTAVIKRKDIAKKNNFFIIPPYKIYEKYNNKNEISI